MLLNCGVGEDSWESLRLQGEIQSVHLKGNQSWAFIGWTDVEAETPLLWPPDTKSWPIWKDPDAGKDWQQEEKGATEDEMVGGHHQLDGHGFGWTPGVGDGTGRPAAVHGVGKSRTRLSDWNEMNWTELMGPDAMILVFWMLSFKPTFSLSSFTFIKRLFSSSLCAIRVVSSAYLRLLIFLLAILIPACASSSPAFHDVLCIEAK